jgi:hypothetical protein
MAYHHGQGHKANIFISTEWSSNKKYPKQFQSLSIKRIKVIAKFKVFKKYANHQGQESSVPTERFSLRKFRSFASYDVKDIMFVCHRQVKTYPQSLRF